MTELCTLPVETDMENAPVCHMWLMNMLCTVLVWITKLCANQISEPAVLAWNWQIFLEIAGWNINVAFVYVHIMRFGCRQMMTPVIRCLGNIVCCASDDQLDFLSQNKQLYQVFSTLLGSEHLHLRKETLWVLSNIAGVCFLLVKQLVAGNYVEYFSMLMLTVRQQLWKLLLQLFHF